MNIDDQYKFDFTFAKADEIIDGFIVYMETEPLGENGIDPHLFHNWLLKNNYPTTIQNELLLTMCYAKMFNEVNKKVDEFF